MIHYIISTIIYKGGCHESGNPFAIETLKFDLRAYTKYVKENELEAKDITPEVLEKFTKK